MSEEPAATEPLTPEELAEVPRDAAPWVTDVLNAAYFRRPAAELTPESGPPDRQVWHTYPPVRMPSLEGTLHALTRPETWPDHAGEVDRFTPLRAGDSARYFAEPEEGLARYGEGEPRALPKGGEPVVGFDLTTHQGHFMGSGHNRLILYSLDGEAYVRAAGTWDPMPWHVSQAYRLAGRAAQHAFWRQGDVVRLSMLHQLALRIEG